MPQVKATAFGRRGSNRSPPLSVRAAMGDPSPPAQNAARPIDESFVALAREMMQDSRREQEVIERGGGVVPWSFWAASLAGLAGAFLQAGLYIVAAKGPVEFMPGVKINGYGDASWLLMLMLYGLMSGARIAVTSLMFSHLALRFVQVTSPAAYAAGGAIGGCIYAYGMQMLGAGPQHVVATAMTGLAAGYLYRIFSGVRAA
ncbi:hypothetical protein PY365_03200 [Roseiarcaceae bacterium H3SJ34-1]|uniref:hypothetical protein n=1 Tax=Terripilifer ovatus TaxID=3032367 RepID=UPI003AB96870|nr:hypothetical protein [Roseiarcaceae bacterium H3SJ34-1]